MAGVKKKMVAGKGTGKSRTKKPSVKPTAKIAPKTPAKTAPAKKAAAPKISVTARPTAGHGALPRTAVFAGFGGRDAEKLPPRLQHVIDRHEITELLANFARGLDRMDENLLRAAIHADASFDLGPGVFQGTGNDYVHWVLGVLQGVKSSHHMLGNIRIEFDGDTALAETYFQTHIRVEKPVGREDVFLGGRTLDRLERRPAGTGGIWKIAHRKEIFDWARTEAVSDIFYHQNPDALWSNRSKHDASQQMAQFPGSQGGKLPAFLGRRYDSKSRKF